MAKQLKKLSFLVEVPYNSGTAGTPRLGQVNYTVEESSDPTMRRHGGIHQGDDPDPVPRDLGGDDLTQSVQAAFLALEAQVKTKEGLA